MSKINSACCERTEKGRLNSLNDFWQITENVCSGQSLIHCCSVFQALEAYALWWQIMTP